MNLQQILKENNSLKKQLSNYKQASGITPFVDDSVLKGGYKVVKTIEDRDKIDCCHKKQGMKVVVVGDDLSFKEYILKSKQCSENIWEEIDVIVDENEVFLIEDYSELGEDLSTQRDLNLVLKQILQNLQTQIDNIELTDEKVQITENTGFAQVGENQKIFNRNVAATVQTQGNEIFNLKGITFEMDIPNQKLILLDRNSVVLTEVSVAFLNDEARHLEYDGVGNLVLKNEQEEVLSTLSVASFINQIGKSLQLDGYILNLLDENNNILSSVTFEISSILGLETALEFINDRLTNLEGLNYTWSPTNRTLTLYDNSGNQLSQVSLQSLDNEGTDLRYNASTLSLELWNADNELIDSIPISSFIGSVGTQLQLNSNQLQLKDSQGNVLSTVGFEISNINGLQTALEGKLSIPTMTNNYYGLWDDTNKRFINSIIYEDKTTFSGSTKLAVNGTGDTRSRALFRLSNGYSNMPYFNFGGTFIWENVTSHPSGAFVGDLYAQNKNIWLHGASKINSDWAEKLIGNSIDSNLSDTLVGGVIDFKNFMDSKSVQLGACSTMWTGYQYFDTLINRNPTAINIHPEMKMGVLHTYNLYNPFQTFLDTDNFFYGWNGVFKKVVGEKLNTTTQLSEKINATKGVNTKDLSFTLQTSITPTPNTLVPKTDGSRPYWINNSSIIKDVALLEDINSTNITNAINSATSAQKTTMRTALLGAATPASPTISGANPSIISKGVDTYIDLYGLNLTLLDPSFIYIKRADDTHINALQFYNLTNTSVRTLWNLPSDLPDGVYQIYIQNGVTVQGASQGYLYVTNQQLTQVNILQNQWIKRLNPQAGGSPAVQNGNGNTYNIALDNYVRLHNSSHNGVNGRSTWKSPNILPTGFNDVWSVSASMLYSGAGASGGTIIPFIGVTKTTDAEFLVPSDINILENTFTQLWAEGMRYGFTGGNLIYNSTFIPLQIVIEKPVGDKIYLKIIYDTGTTITTVYQNAVPITLDSNYAIFMNLQPSVYGNMWWSAQFTVKKLI